MMRDCSPLSAHNAMVLPTNSASGFESLAGDSANEIYQDLIEMKYRSVPEGIMDLQARGYTDEQLRMIADYLAAQQPTRTTKPKRNR